MANFEHILTDKDVTIATKERKDLVFPVSTCRGESWTVKQRERKRTEASKCGARRGCCESWTARTNSRPWESRSGPRTTLH